MLHDELSKNDNFIIFGAQVIAYGAYCAIKHLYNVTPEFFAVSSLVGNPSEIDGISVVTIDAISKDCLIIVGVTELVQKEVIPMLKEKGYNNVFVLTQHEEYLLMSQYFKSLGVFQVCSGSVPGLIVDLGLYEVRNHRDAVLNCPPVLNEFEKTIQAGAAITDIRVASILDSTGDNISVKNKQYCEMSATYWVWKNTNHAWKGIEHYRRHMLVTPSMLDDSVDAILPLPYICYPDTSVQFRRFVSEEVFCALLESLEAIHPKEIELYKQILYGKYQYTYNIVCAKASVFDEYCRWFFEITEYMETMADRVPEIKETRALSYVAEVLTNIFFMSMQDKLVIRHVEREIYI